MSRPETTGELVTGCTECAAFTESMRTLDAALQRIPRFAIQPDLMASLQNLTVTGPPVSRRLSWKSEIWRIILFTFIATMFCMVTQVLPSEWHDVIQTGLLFAGYLGFALSVLRPFFVEVFPA